LKVFRQPLELKGIYEDDEFVLDGNGKQGWELVTVIPAPSSVPKKLNFLGYLKRLAIVEKEPNSKQERIVTNIEANFHNEMLNIYKKAKAECHYNATYFLRMVSEVGGLETAKRLLSTDAS